MPLWRRYPLVGRLLGGAFGLVASNAVGYGLGYTIGLGWAILASIFIFVFITHIAFTIGGLAGAGAAVFGFVPMVGGLIMAPTLRELDDNPPLAIASFEELIAHPAAQVFVFPLVSPDVRHVGYHSTRSSSIKGTTVSSVAAGPLVGKDGRVYGWVCEAGFDDGPKPVGAAQRTTPGDCTRAAARAVAEHHLDVAPGAPFLNAATDMEQLRRISWPFWTVSLVFLAAYTVLVLGHAVWERGRRPIEYHGK